MIAIVDYGMGNLHSVAKALETVGARAQITSEPSAITQAEKVVLPGVGAFDAAMTELTRRQLVDPLRRVIASGTPYLGICLGLQLLFETSEEGEPIGGLGVLPGRVRRFKDSSLKIPHMGWNQVTSVQRAAVSGQKTNSCPLLQGIPDGSFFYFVHSFYGEPADASIVSLETDYGGRFAAMVWRDRLFATQFHPEKSQEVGLRLLENFVKL